MAFLLTIVESILALLERNGGRSDRLVRPQALTYQTLFGPNLERDLGFREGKSILPGSSLLGYASAVAVTSVTDDGLFAAAGIRAGDVLPDESHTSLFKEAAPPSWEDGRTGNRGRWTWASIS